MKRKTRRTQGITGMRIATGFDFQPLPDGNVSIEFVGDDGKTINRQVVTAEVVKRIPFVALMTEITLERGLGVAKKIMEELGQIGRLSRRVPGCPELMEGDIDTVTVAELMKALGTRKGKAKILLHLSDRNGRIVEGVLPDQAPDFGVGNDSLNVVYLYGVGQRVRSQRAD
jgi:hypothetical protein